MKDTLQTIMDWYARQTNRMVDEFDPADHFVCTVVLRFLEANQEGLKVEMTDKLVPIKNIPFRAYRKGLGLSQKQISDKLGITRTTVRDIEAYNYEGAKYENVRKLYNFYRDYKDE